VICPASTLTSFEEDELFDIGVVSGGIAYKNAFSSETRILCWHNLMRQEKNALSGSVKLCHHSGP